MSMLWISFYLIIKCIPFIELMLTIPVLIWGQYSCLELHLFFRKYLLNDGEDWSVERNQKGRDHLLSKCVASNGWGAVCISTVSQLSFWACPEDRRIQPDNFQKSRHPCLWSHFSPFHAHERESGGNCN